MNDDVMLKLLICFIIGYLLAKYMGNGFSVGGKIYDTWDEDIYNNLTDNDKVLTFYNSFNNGSCLKKMKEVCNNKSDVADCMVCAGMNVTEMRDANCNNDNIETNCINMFK